MIKRIGARAALKGLSLAALAICSLLTPLQLAQAHARSAPALRAFPLTATGVSVFADQLSPSLTEALFQFTATHYVGTQKMLQRDADHLRSYNPQMIILHYRLPLGESDASVRIIDGNNWITDYPYVNTQDGWFYHRNGSRVYKTDSKYYLMDPSTGWRDYWTQQVNTEIADNHDDAVFADSCSVPNYLGTSSWSPALPAIDPTFEAWWSQQIDSFLAYARANLHGAKVIPNAGYWITSRDATDYSQADGVMIEGFSEWSAHNPFALSDWQLEMNRVLSLENKGRIIIDQNYLGSDSDVSTRLFYLGNYLLTKGNYTYLDYFATSFQPWWYPEWRVPIGAPSTALPATINGLYDAASGLYRRAYSNGLVVVNPTSASRTLSLGGTYYRVTPVGGGIVPQNANISAWHLNYTALSKVTLAPNTAAILVRTPSLA